jgi:hydrogenase 3 maturation protease
MKLQVWQWQILQDLEDLACQKHNLRIAIVGIGNDQYGDDAIGVEVTRWLLASPVVSRQDRLVIVGGFAPESYCGVIRRFHPDLVILIDAADMNLPATSVRWIVGTELLSGSLLSCTIPINLLVDYLRAEIGCAVGLIGIQPQQICWGSPSDYMEQHALQISSQIAAVLQLHENNGAFCSYISPSCQRRRIQHGAKNPT